MKAKKDFLVVSGGFFIVIAGGNGSGKETQCKLLVERLKKENFKVADADFPRHNHPAFYCGDKYLNGEYGDINEVGPYRGSVFFTVDRYDDSERIRKFLAEGGVMTSNRYTSANMGHQGGKIKDKHQRNQFLDWLDDFEFSVMGIPKPNLTTFLHVPAEISDKLVEKRGNKKDAHEKDKEHNKNTEEAYIYAAEKYGWPTIECVIDGELRSREAIHEDVWNVVKPLIYKE